MFYFKLVTDEWLEQATSGATVLASDEPGACVLRLRNGCRVVVRRVPLWRALPAILFAMVARWLACGEIRPSSRVLTWSGLELQTVSPAPDRARVQRQKAGDWARNFAGFR